MFEKYANIFQIIDRQIVDRNCNYKQKIIANFGTKKILIFDDFKQKKLHQ